MNLPLPIAALSTLELSVVLLFCGAVIGALLTLLVRFQRRWVEPARRLEHGIALHARGEWSASVPTADAGALKNLTRAANAAAEHARKQVASLNTQKLYLRSLVDALPDPIVLADHHERITLINTPAAKLLGVQATKVLGQRMISVISDAPVMSLIEQTLASSDTPPRTADIRLMRHGQRLSFQAVAQRTDDGGVLLVLRDISTLASAVQMKTDFVANASHELRTPISAIKIAFETLSEVFGDDLEQSEKCLRIIGDQLRRLEEMLRDLLDLSRVERIELQPTLAWVEGSHWLTSLASTWLPLARERGVSLHVAATSVRFVSDRHLLELITKNLIENAVKFTPAGGRVTVELTPDLESVTLRVTDTGCGIPQQHLDRVFERFYQVDSARTPATGRGTGLGLAIVKHAAHALGGSVFLESAVARGTIATCVLPTLDASE